MTREVSDVFVRRISEYMYAQNMLPGGNFIIGVSGGADSVCLLLVLQKLAEAGECRIRAVHVHHGLRCSADDDQRYVQDLCAELQVPCKVVRVNAGEYARKTGMGVEEAARTLRYEIFEESRCAWEREEGISCKTAVAHHMEDQAETLLFHLCRGSNLAGAGGMRPVSGNIVRPLLKVRRQDIESFLSAEKIAWCTDETNADPSYMRNLLRLQVMPLLREVNSRADVHLCEFAREAQEIDAFMSEQTDLALQRCRIRQLSKQQPKKDDDRDSLAETPVADCGDSSQEESICLSIDRLLEVPLVVRKRVLYQAVAVAAGRKKDIGGQHIALLMEFAGGFGYGEISLPYDLVVRREYGRLTIGRRDILKLTEDRYFDKNRYSEIFPTSGDEYSCRVLETMPGASEIPTKKYTKWFDYDKISSLPVFRTRQPGDRITVTDDGISKKLSRYMIDEKISRTCRDRMVLPMCGQDTLWIPGYRMSAAYKVTQSTRRILEIKWFPGESIE